MKEVSSNLRTDPRRLALTATAYHEAGHAVAAFFARVPFKHVTIKPDGDMNGHVRYVRPRRLTWAGQHARGMVALAGETAQCRFEPRSARGHHGASDRATVAMLALDVGGGPAVVNALIGLWQAQADELVEGRWDCIERVAATLLERETLTAAEVRDAILAPVREWIAVEAEPRGNAATQQHSNTATQP